MVAVWEKQLQNSANQQWFLIYQVPFAPHVINRTVITR